MVLAVPVAPPDSLAELASHADEVVCLESPPQFFAVGQWYENFSQVPDEQVTALLAKAHAAGTDPEVEIAIGPGVPGGATVLNGDLTVPPDAAGMVLFAHGSGSSRHSPRNRSVARALDEGGLATLLLDLLTPDEAVDHANVFDVELLAARLDGAAAWLQSRPDTSGLPLGYFGASTGAAAALWAASAPGSPVAAVVSRGGRPDLAGPRLGAVRAPTLFIVGGRDDVVLALNEQAARSLRCEHRLDVVPGATHLFEEPGALEVVADLARDWFTRHFR